MFIDEDRLRERLGKKFTSDVVDNILIDLRTEGLPLKIGVSKLNIKIGEEVSINFLNQKGEPPTENDILMKCNWEAQINNIDPIQIQSITIPTLNYTDVGFMNIDVSFYPFKIKNIFKKKQKGEK